MVAGEPEITGLKDPRVALAADEGRRVLRQILSHGYVAHRPFGFQKGRDVLRRTGDAHAFEQMFAAMTSSNHEVYLHLYLEDGPPLL